MASSFFIAVAGNPNSGKTTAFNRYTGSRRHVGNYPGVTVEKTEGIAHLGGREVRLVDLPGTYSLTAYSLEEVVSRRVLMLEKPGAVLDVVNASVLERNLYLTVQLLELGLPVIIALNMMDEARAHGLRIDIDKLRKLMGVQVIPTVARTGEGLEEALRAAVALAESSAAGAETEGTGYRPLEISYGPDIDAVLQELVPYVREKAFLTDIYPARWIVLKFLEKDEEILRQGRKASPEVAALLEERTAKLEAHLQATLHTYPEGVISEYRFGYISSILRQGVLTRAEELRERVIYSDKVDSVVTHRFFGFFILIGVLYAMYWCTFTLGAYPEEWIGAFFGWLGDLVGSSMQEGLLKSLIVAGAIDGVGTVLGFAPLIMVMFLFISVIEDSGYMARIAYMLDRIFRIFGLHGASVMPFIISGGLGGGCAVPGIMATRTLRSPKERLATILTAPFMTCGAKAPVFLLFVSIFFSRYKDLMMVGITLTGWLTALLCALFLRSTVIKGEATPFVMELPPYRLPTLRGVLIHTWERSWQYIKKAGTIILAIAVLMWAAMTFPGLSEEEGRHFETLKAGYEEELAALPSGKLSARIGELNEMRAQLMQKEQAGSAEAAAERASVEAALGAVRAEFASTPINALQTSIDILTEELESLGTHPETATIRGLLAEHEKTLEQLPADGPAAQALQKEIESLTVDLVSTAQGRLHADIKALQKELDAVPEKQLQAKIEEVDHLASAEALRRSFGGRLGLALEPITAPAGFDWRTNIALVGGIAAKEVVLATLGTAYSLGAVDEEDTASLEERLKADPHWTTASVAALLLFTLLYSPCFVSLAVIKQESGSWKWLFFSLFFNLGVAYIASVAVYQILR